ncbi:hypothetical protein pdam_00008655 [Pocillopora damicornis]|uniref:Uncharacterized protein n=1 Tax=Pocillopora damicornis TaxID=46731 RepID=A0A3M6TJH8_POCDA|nr:hypothetical protein pdam_00008655 [Pocillopora damicornis]
MKRRNHRLWRNVFAKWANEKKQKKNLEEYDNETFDKNCCSFIPTMRSLRYEALGKFREHSRSESCSQLRMFRALQTSHVLHISMNAR